MLTLMNHVVNRTAGTQEVTDEQQEVKKPDDQNSDDKSSVENMDGATKTQQIEQNLSNEDEENTSESRTAGTQEVTDEHQEANKTDSESEPTPSSLPCEKNECKHQESLTQMETYYKGELKKKDSTIQKLWKEMKSLKDRLAQDMAVSIKTGDTESMNDPVSKTRLTEMYKSLKLEKWIEIKDLLKSSKTSPESTRALVQKTFKDAAEEMRRIKQQIEETFGSTESSSGQENQKVDGYRKLAVHNLQLARYHSNKDLLKSPFPKYEGEKAEDVMVNLRRLTSECYWLGCLIALNNPPLQPDWESQHYEENSWDIFPHGLKDSDK
ncbi:uncharacterized protein LOC103461775 [Poecilia reticulata]|uniref:uncharacterized protein LOC103461775 n=1 Tax=Poecilia reticulata TaxID=8081 RepID=UPI0007EBCF18|nr:PREDICTED: uncharacterized protein LOC103461775 [Poecilia reticulata]